jgi:hypothetical protein
VASNAALNGNEEVAWVPQTKNNTFTKMKEMKKYEEKVSQILAATKSASKPRTGAKFLKLRHFQKPLPTAVHSLIPFYKHSG